MAFLVAEMPMIAFACLNYLTWHRSKGPQMFMKYAGMTMEERDPLVAEWANTIRVEEVPTASAQKKPNVEVSGD